LSVKLRKKNDRYTIYDLELEGLTLSVTYLNPGKSTIGHLHGFEEAYYICRCDFGKIKIGTQTREISSGNFITIPPDTFHRVFNDGENILTFICAFKGRK